MRRRILVAENDGAMRDLLREHLQSRQWHVTAVSGGAEASDALQQDDFALVLTDLMMEPVDGFAVLRDARRLQPQAPVVIMTAHATVQNALAAMRAGAYDYLTKPFDLAELTGVASRALEASDSQCGTRASPRPPRASERFCDLVGRSRAIQTVFDQIRAVADSDAAVLLTGETGSGKELVARAVHRTGARAARPFVAVNCAAIPEALLEAELFGHEKGAFTGANRRRHGLAVDANGGTLFLDEIGEMPLALQVKLLRVLEERAVRPVGADVGIRTDFRVISATNRDLASLIAGGLFRADLYYRLAVFPIRVPALRERRDDILLLAHALLERAAAALNRPLALDRSAEDALLAHDWPGNVRELENVIQRAATLGSGPVLVDEDLRFDVWTQGELEPGPRATLVDFAGQTVTRVLAEVDGDQREAARILGITATALRRIAGSDRAVSRA